MSDLAFQYLVRRFGTVRPTEHAYVICQRVTVPKTWVCKELVENGFNGKYVLHEVTRKLADLRLCTTFCVRFSDISGTMQKGTAFRLKHDKTTYYLLPDVADADREAAGVLTERLDAV